MAYIIFLSLPGKQCLQATSLVDRGGVKNSPLVLPSPPCVLLFVLAHDIKLLKFRTREPRPENDIFPFLYYPSIQQFISYF